MALEAAGAAFVLDGIALARSHSHAVTCIAFERPAG
jgi:hypothetical protein